jgi:hypothetical protein
MMPDYDDDDKMRGDDAYPWLYAVGFVFVRITAVAAILTACAWYWIWLGQLTIRAMRAAIGYEQ